MIDAAPLISHLQVAALIRTARLDLSREKLAQADLYTFLAGRLPLGVALEREVRLSGSDIPDLMIDGRIAVELKAIKARAAEVLPQLERYAAHRRVEAIILASNKAVDVPPLIGGKPAVFVSLGRAWM
jgi:hypothetical protein